MELSFFKGFTDTNPESITLDALVALMRTDESVRDITEKHRYYRETDDKASAKYFKHRMPCFGVAARFVGGKRKEHITALTGLSLVDIDHIAPDQMAAVLEKVHADEHTLLAYTTLSGQGVRVLFRYEASPNPSQGGEPGAAMSAENSQLTTNGQKLIDNSQEPFSHADSTDYTEDSCLAGKINLTQNTQNSQNGKSLRPCCHPDGDTKHYTLNAQQKDNDDGVEVNSSKSSSSSSSGLQATLLCADKPAVVATDAPLASASSLSFSLYKTAFLQCNEYYSTLTGLDTDLQCKNVGRLSTIAHDENLYYNPEAVPFVIQYEEKKAVGRPKKGKGCKVNDVESIIIRELERRGIEYAPGTYNRYVSAACYEMNRYGVPEEQCRQWAVKRFADYETSDVEAIVHSCYLQTEEHGTAKVRRSTRSDSSVGDVRDIRDYLTTHEVKTRYNVITRKYEIYNEDADTWCEKTDRMESTLYCRITEEIGKRILKSDLHQLLCSEFSPEYNPFVDYLTALPPLADDDDTDYIDLVASMVHVPATDEAKHRRWFKKWFVAMVASWLNPEVTNHVILAYIGRQGIYKSTFMRRLLPPALSGYFSVRNYASRMDKDDRLMLAEKGLVALEEIDSLTPRELNQLKAIVTAETIDERDAYSSNRETRVHIASFCATGNNRRFLTDLTGNRRWLPFYVMDIDSPYDHPIDYEHLYAQAYALYCRGFRYWFESDEVAELDTHNSNFEEPNMVQELIETYLRRPYDGETGQFYSSANILTAITAYCGSRVAMRPRDISICMNRLGYMPCRVGNLRGWNVVPLSGDDIHNNHCLNAHRSQPDGE